MLGQVAVEYFDRCAAGEQVSIEELATRYPDIADDIRRTFPAMEIVGQTNPRAISDEVFHPPVNKQLGDFRILHELGRGGMGVVYEAEQLSVGRRVALKVLPFAPLADARSLQRFRNEVRAAATLDHPHIVTVYSVGEERGIHYFAMHLVQGNSLAEVLSDLRQLRTRPEPQPGGNADQETRANAAATTSVPVPSGHDFYRRVAELGKQAAAALQFAHDNGVIHRDIKPANLLLDKSGNLFVADFGLARVESDVNLTMSGDLLGTLRYMAPEQASARRGVIDHRTDVYALGITLYEFVTLQPAIDGEDQAELLRKVAHETPAAPSTIAKDLPPDLETIILTAINKDPHDRYSSAGDLAADLDRFLELRPITAKRPTPVQRSTKWIRRHPAFSGVLLLVALLLTAISGLAFASASRRAEQERLEAYGPKIMAAARQVSEGRFDIVRQQLQELQPQAGQSDLRGVEWFALKEYVDELEVASTSLGKERAHQVVFSPDGTRLAVATSARGLYLFDANLQRVRQLRPPGGATITRWLSDLVAFSPDGRYLYSTLSNGPGIDRYDLDSQQPVAEKIGAENCTFADAVSVSADGRLAVTGSVGNETELSIWDGATGEYLQKLDSSGGYTLDWSPDGQFVLRGGWGVLTMYSTVTGRAVHDWEGNCFSARFSPSGDFIVGFGSRITTVVDLRFDQPRRYPSFTAKSVFSVAFSGDTRFVTASMHGEVIEWEIIPDETPQRAKIEAMRRRQFELPVRCIASSPTTSQAIAGVGNDLLIPKLSQFAVSTYEMYSETLTTRDGLVTLGTPSNQRLQTWNPKTGVIEDLTASWGPNELLSLSYSPNGEYLAVSTTPNLPEAPVRIPIFSTPSGDELRVLELDYRVVFTADNDHVVGYSREGCMKIWDWRTGAEISRSKDERALQIRNSPAVRTARCGNWLAASSSGVMTQGVVLLWRLAGTEFRFVQEIKLFNGASCLTFTPDGTWLAFGCSDGIELYRLSDGKRQRIRAGQVESFDFSPDGSRLVSSHRGTLKFWDHQANRLVGFLEVGRYLPCVRFISDRQLVYVSRGVGASLLGSP